MWKIGGHLKARKRKEQPPGTALKKSDGTDAYVKMTLKCGEEKH